MPVPALCDVNVLLALLTNAHSKNVEATRWFEQQPAGGVKICRATQLGLLRLLNNPSVMKDDVQNGAECWDIWKQLLKDHRIRFVATEPAGIEKAFMQLTATKSYAHAIWPDAYLAAFAIAGNLTLATFDKGFSQYKGLKLDTLA